MVGTLPRIQRAHDRRTDVVPFVFSLLALFQTGAELHSLRAVVADSKGAPIRDLTTSDVSLLRGGATVTIERFEKDERPLDLALLIDSSEPASTHYRLQIVDAAKAFIASLPSNTRISVWTTGDRPSKIVDKADLAEGATGREISSKLERVFPTGGNTILDALVEASADLVKAEGERRIIAFISCEGTGFANDSRESVVDRVRKTGVEVMGALIAEGRDSSGGDVSSQDYDYVFAALAESTGGRLERPLSSMAARVAMARVAADLRSTYRLAYFQTEGARQSRVALEVARPAVKVRLSAPRKETSSP